MPYSANPPGLISRLNSTTYAPASANFLAAYSPAGPAPIMPIRCPRSVCVCVILPLFLVCYIAEIMPAIAALPSLRVYGEQHLADIAPFLEKTVCCRGCGERERVRNDRMDLSLPIEL